MALRAVNVRSASLAQIVVTNLAVGILHAMVQVVLMALGRVHL